MTIAVDLQALSPCDSLYVSPHHDDVLLSCGARLLADAARGLRILVVTVFGEGARPWPDVGALAAPGIRHLALGLPDARRRSDYYSSFQALVEGRRADDDGWVKQLAQALGDIGHRSKASQVYVPLGVGSHIDHRLSHEASLRALQSGDGRNVFLYEERPEAFVRGAVRVRLGQMGARLPPAAIHAADRARLAAFPVALPPRALAARRPQGLAGAPPVHRARRAPVAAGTGLASAEGLRSAAAAGRPSHGARAARRRARAPGRAGLVERNGRARRPPLRRLRAPAGRRRTRRALLAAAAAARGRRHHDGGRSRTSCSPRARARPARAVPAAPPSDPGPAARAC